MAIFNWFIEFAAGFGQWCQNIWDWGTTALFNVGGTDITAFGLIVGGGAFVMVGYWLIKMFLPN